MIQFFRKNPHLLLMLLGVIVGVASVTLMVRSKDAEMRRDLLSQARAIDLALDWSKTYATIQPTPDAPILETPALAVHRERMANICSVYPSCRAVYLMRQNAKKQIYFLIDSDPKGSDLYIIPGTIYKEAHEALYKVFNTQKMVMDGPETDRWGVWMSAFVPHTLPDQSTVVVGIDIEAKDWNKNLRDTALLPSLATLIFLSLLGLYLLMWRIKDKQNEVLELQHHQLVKLTHEDILTGLPNRRLFEDRLTQLIASVSRNGSKFAVFYLDLDKFKTVNDTFGHDAGDQVLCAVSERFAKQLRTEDTVARLSGDEFAMLLPNISDKKDAAYIAQKIIDALAAPIDIKDNVVNVTVSIGIAMFSGAESTVHELIRAADKAMYVAKRAGAARYCFFGE